jgi:hypothetical protein
MSTSTRSLAAFDVPLFGPAERTLPLTSLFSAAEKLLDFAAVLGAIHLADIVYRTMQPARAG